MRSKQKTTKKLMDLLEAVNKALNETSKYLEGGEKNRETEFKLAELWGTASIKAFPVEVELADRYQSKATFWRQTETQNWETIEKLNISIKSIEADIKYMITGERPSKFASEIEKLLS